MTEGDGNFLLITRNQTEITLSTQNNKQATMTSLVESSAPGADIQSFITNFYRLSDDPETHEPWINAFTTDAYVQIGSQKAKGSEGQSG